MIDLWDWDIHFEKELEDDWYFEAVFGSESSVSDCSEQLAEKFVESVDEFRMDYDQDRDPQVFAEFVRGGAPGNLLARRPYYHVAKDRFLRHIALTCRRARHKLGIWRKKWLFIT